MRLIDADHLKSMLQEYIKREQAYIDIGNNTKIAIGHSNGLWEAIAQIDEEPTIEPEQRWIPCSERLPEEYGEFLVTMTEKAKAEDLGFDLDETYIRKMRYNSNGWQLPSHIPSWINDVVKDEVLAWMPLLVQEPYQEEGEKNGKDT